MTNKGQMLDIQQNTSTPQLFCWYVHTFAELTEQANIITFYTHGKCKKNF